MKIKNLILPLIVLIFSAISTYADQLAEDRGNKGGGGVSSLE